ncbi:hypothetical protein K493DRAFT_336822 [Basidiobolus meristosporus CBS 931.73]|uniref:Uncharacterized protein n=1 Tax=Basidiobolus meristosporus CBS 931.73 TaxID=1314790 RepID=A0A1Y1YFA9_9FUNG|nr:hypothetical protein K493DRAFT_336822 [Basidiobolus meristosporus CBS 931.73]|eukprot:ORX96667.1 hypothetical protein K493DRAFT_336822 [Basidiobolus meristosporus CBS 931.73]
MLFTEWLSSCWVALIEEFINKSTMGASSSKSIAHSCISLRSKSARSHSIREADIMQSIISHPLVKLAGLGSPERRTPACPWDRREQFRKQSASAQGGIDQLQSSMSLIGLGDLFDQHDRSTPESALIPTILMMDYQDALCSCMLWSSLTMRNIHYKHHELTNVAIWRYSATKACSLSTGEAATEEMDAFHGAVVFDKMVFIYANHQAFPEEGLIYVVV